MSLAAKYAKSAKGSAEGEACSAEAPAWHADVLAARRRKVESGEAEFLSVEESERRLAREADLSAPLRFCV